MHREIGIVIWVVIFNLGVLQPETLFLFDFMFRLYFVATYVSLTEAVYCLIETPIEVKRFHQSNRQLGIKFEGYRVV